MKRISIHTVILSWRNRASGFRMKKNIFILFVFKILYTFYGVFIFGKISTISDADSYLAAGIEFSRTTLTSNTMLMGTITALLKKILFFDISVHLTYSLFSFYCLKLVIQELKLSRRHENFLVFMLILPTFGMWTSVIVKESLSGSLTCFVLIWIINIVNRTKLRYPLIINILCLYFTFVLRPIVGVSLIFLIATLYTYRLPILNKYVRFYFMCIVIILFTVGAVFLTLKYVKDQFIPMAEYYFDPRFSDSKSTRKLGFWKTAADFYLKAPQGIFIANLGPNFMETVNNPFFIPYFFEGLIFIFSSLFLMFSNLYYELRRAVINPNFLFVIFFGVIMVLLLNYPFGLFNPGSAIRYRSSYYHIIVILLLFFYSREKKLARQTLSV